MSPGQVTFLLALMVGCAAWTLSCLFRSVGRSRSPATDLEATRKIELLAAENGRLTGQIGRLEERIAVLERIVTDGGYSVAHQIEALR